MLSCVGVNYLIIIINEYLLFLHNHHPEGESMKVGFDGGIRFEFHGARVIPLSGNGGVPAYRDLDDALGLC